MDDVIVIGGGVIGLSIAFELAGKGVAVVVLESGDFGREASWAGAGILPPGNLAAAETPNSQLRALSHFLWSGWAESLSAETGIDTGYRRCGGLEVCFERAATLHDEMRAWHDEGVEVEEHSASSLRELEPNVSPQIGAAYCLPQLGQVRNPRLLKAAVAGCAARGVRLCAGTPAVAFNERDGQVRGVQTPTSVVSGGRYCVAGGPWSRMILSSVGVDVRVEPVRGQIVLVSHVPRLFSHVIQVGPRYLVPRDDGCVLIGSTEEHAGFQKANTPSAMSDLLAFGTKLVPMLGEARFERAWSGLRPSSADGLPYLGRVSDWENLFVAAGHFRSGLQMSPGTARLLSQSLLDQETDISLEPFATARPAPAFEVRMVPAFEPKRNR